MGLTQKDSIEFCTKAICINLDQEDLIKLLDSKDKSVKAVVRETLKERIKTTRA